MTGCVYNSDCETGDVCDLIDASAKRARMCVPCPVDMNMCHDKLNCYETCFKPPPPTQDTTGESKHVKPLAGQRKSCCHLVSGIMPGRH